MRKKVLTEASPLPEKKVAETGLLCFVCVRVHTPMQISTAPKEACTQGLAEPCEALRSLYRYYLDTPGGEHFAWSGCLAGLWPTLCLWANPEYWTTPWALAVCT